MQNFLRHFFGYFRYPDSNGILGKPEPFNDMLGRGFGDPRHILLILVTPILCVWAFKHFRRNPENGRGLLRLVLALMLAVRVCNQTYRAAIGAELPVLRALPFHMCTMLSFLLPLAYLFKWRKILEPACVVAMMGGGITILIPPFFESRFMSFFQFESMMVHIVLLAAPIIIIAVGDLRLERKNLWKSTVMIFAFFCWAMFGNEVLFYEYGTNYMYLHKNILPGNFGGNYFLVIYYLIFSAVLTGIYAVRPIYLRYFETEYSITVVNAELVENGEEAYSNENILPPQ